MQVFVPLFDAYASSVRSKNLDNPRLSPILASLEKLPENILLIIPTMDILLHEQTTFIQRIKEDASKDSTYAGRRYEALFMEKQMHGWDQCKLEKRRFRHHQLTDQVPSFTDEMRTTKQKSYQAAVDFLNDIHKKHGFVNTSS